MNPEFNTTFVIQHSRDWQSVDVKELNLYKDLLYFLTFRAVKLGMLVNVWTKVEDIQPIYPELKECQLQNVVQAKKI
ncbi:MAG: hypothetical protein EPO28_04410 [Saprospiraceae bacterium]|nr:MAG: hypothetical protein EPO28_04410 [Saprospiraceae bacterium]